MLRDFVEVACLPELPGQDPGQCGLVSITYTASIKLLELLANFAGALSCAFHYSFISKLVLFLVLKIVLMIALFLVLNFVLMIVLFLVLNFVLMIVIPGFFDAQPAFAKLWPVLLLDRPGSRAPRCAPPQTTESETARVCEACGPRLLLYRPGNPRPK